MQYFFDSNDGDKFDADEIGLELPTTEAARRLAVSALVDLARDKSLGVTARQLSIEVRDAEGSDLFKVFLSFETSETVRDRQTDDAPQPSAK